MALIGVLQTLVDGQIITAAQHNSNYGDIKTAFNTSAVLTDVAKVITVTHIWSASQTFSGGLSSGPITSTADGLVLSRTGASTSFQYARFANTSGDVYFGVEGSVAGGAFTGSLAYASIIYSIAQPVQIIAGTTAVGRTLFNTTGVQIGGSLSTGVISSIADGQILVRTGASAGFQTLRFANTSGDVYLGVEGSAAGGFFTGSLAYASILYSMAQPFQIITGATATGRTLFNSAGVAIGGTLSLGAAGVVAAALGEIVLPNNKALRGENAAATNTLPLIKLNAAGRVEIDSGAQDIQFGTNRPALGGGAAPTLGTIGGAGPTVAAQNAWLKFFDAGGVAIFVPFWK